MYNHSSRISRSAIDEVVAIQSDKNSKPFKKNLNLNRLRGTINTSAKEADVMDAHVISRSGANVLRLTLEPVMFEIERIEKGPFDTSRGILTAREAGVRYRMTGIEVLIDCDDFILLNVK